MYVVVPRRHPRAGADERRARRPARRRLDPGPVRDLARPDPRALPRGRLRAADRVRERRPARDPRDRRRRPGGHARPRPHRKPTPRASATSPCCRCATRRCATCWRATAAGGRPTQADARDGRRAGARRGSHRPEPPSSLPGHGGAAHRRQGDRAGRCARRSSATSPTGSRRATSAPGLATVLVGDDPASALYVGNKQKASAEVGIQGFDHRLPQDAPHDEVEGILQDLAADPRVSGILLQLPTPPQVDGAGLAAHDPAGQGRRRPHAALRGPARPGPPRPAAVHAVGDHGAAAAPRRADSRAPRRSWSAAPTSSAARSPRCCWPPTPPSPSATPSTRDLGEVCRRADILVAAVGRPGLVKGDWIKPGATVIDVGSPKGDVEFEPAAERAGPDHARPRRRRPDDDRDAAAQHAARRPRRPPRSRWGPGGAEPPPPGRADRRRRRGGAARRDVPRLVRGRRHHQVGGQRRPDLASASPPGRRSGSPTSCSRSPR